MKDIEKSAPANRNFKDGFFRVIFKDPQRFLQLYCALRGITLAADTVMQEVTLEDALYRGYKNDVAFKIDNRVVVFVEHQSTVCPNIAARMLAYMNETYRPLLVPEVMDSAVRMPLPQPEFYAIYNGRAGFPERQTVRLSDLYEPHDKNIGLTLDLAVRIYNINTGNNPDLMRRCPVLGEYEIFVELVRNYEKTLGLNAAVERAIKECMKRGILVEILKTYGKEVTNMLYAELDQVKLREVWTEGGRMEGREEGRKEGEEKGRAQVIELIERGVSLDEIKRILAEKQGGRM